MFRDVCSSYLCSGSGHHVDGVHAERLLSSSDEMKGMEHFQVPYQPLNTYYLLQSDNIALGDKCHDYLHLRGRNRFRVVGSLAQGHRALPDLS